jgi:ATP-dependent Lon protease
MTDEAKKAIPPEGEEPDAEAPGAGVPVTGSQGEEKEGGPEIPAVLPLLPVRDIVIFPYMTLPLFVCFVQAVEK